MDFVFVLPCASLSLMDSEVLVVNAYWDKDLSRLFHLFPCSRNVLLGCVGRKWNNVAIFPFLPLFVVVFVLSFSDLTATNQKILVSYPRRDTT